MCGDLEEAPSKWKPREIKEPSWRGKKQVKNLTQEGDLLKKQIYIQVLTTLGLGHMFLKLLARLIWLIPFVSYTQM